MITAIIRKIRHDTGLLECLRTTRPHVDDSVLIVPEDDRNVDDCEAHISKIVRDSLDNPHLALDAAMHAATFDWLWFVDSTERIPRAVGDRLRDLIERHGDEFESVSLPLKNYFFGQWVRFGGQWPLVKSPTVAKRGFFAYDPSLRQFVLTGRQLNLPADPEWAIEDHRNSNIRTCVQHFNERSSTDAKSLHDAGDIWNWRRAVDAMTTELWARYESGLGIVDGAHGWILAWLSAQERWLTHAKLIEWDRTSHDEDTRCPYTLDEFLDHMNLNLRVLRAGNPVLPLGVVLCADLWGVDYISWEARDMARAFAVGHRPVVVEHTSTVDVPLRLSPASTALFRALSRGKHPPSAIRVLISNPSVERPPCPAASVNVIRTHVGTDRVPEGWLKILESFDEIWVPSEFAKCPFLRVGIAPEKVRIIHSFVDIEEFQSGGAKLESPFAIRPRFVFLSLYDASCLTGWDAVLRAYIEEFRSDEGIGLVIAFQVGAHDAVSVPVAPRDRVWQYHAPVIAGRSDVVTEGGVTVHLPTLFRSVDALVLPSRGEDGGRCQMQAMACGLPN